MKLSTYFGTKEPVTSPFARSSNLYEAKPTIGETIGAYVEETFQGEGSLSQDISAMNIRYSDKRNTPLTEDEWKSSENYREGLNFYPTMSEYSAKTLARIKDDRDNRQMIMDKASKLQTVAGFGVGFLSGMAEPKNLVSGVAAAIATGGAGVVVPSFGRMISVNSVRAAAGRGAAEGVVGAALTEPSNIESSKTVQGDYTFADSMLNLAMGSVLGGGLGAGGKALELKSRGQKLEQLKAERQIVQAYRAERPDIAVKEFDTALGQIAQGAEVEVSSVKAIDDIERVTKARQELPKIEEKIAATGVTKVTDLPEFKAWFEGSKVVDDTGAPMVVYHGTNVDFNEFKTGINITDTTEYPDLIWISTSTRTANAYVREDMPGGNIKPVYINIKNPIDYASFQNKPDIKYWKEKGHDGIVSESVYNMQPFGGNIEPFKNYAAFSNTQIKSIFNRGKFDPNDPRLIDIDEAERLQVKKGQIESDSKIQPDNAPIKKLQDSISRPDNSTAYDVKDSLEIDQYLKESGDMEEQIRIEQELEGFKEEISELENQGLLTEDEIKIIEQLADIDAESAIFDNVLLNAKICLTRG